jgi:hypothetical protein
MLEEVIATPGVVAVVGPMLVQTMDGLVAQE